MHDEHRCFYRDGQIRVYEAPSEVDACREGRGGSVSSLLCRCSVSFYVDHAFVILHFLYVSCICVINELYISKMWNNEYTMNAKPTWFMTETGKYGCTRLRQRWTRVVEGGGGCLCATLSTRTRPLSTRSIIWSGRVFMGLTKNRTQL